MKLQTWFMFLICLAVLPIAAPAEQKSCSQPRWLNSIPARGPSPGLGTGPRAINNLGEIRVITRARTPCTTRSCALRR